MMNNDESIANGISVDKCSFSMKIEFGAVSYTNTQHERGTDMKEEAKEIPAQVRSGSDVAFKQSWYKIFCTKEDGSRRWERRKMYPFESYGIRCPFCGRCTPNIVFESTLKE